MMTSLDHLLLSPPLPGEVFQIPAGHWNELLGEIRRRMETIGPGRSRPRPFVHPWKCRVDRWEDGNPDLDWRIDVAPGTVNDQLAAIPYRKENDPRGWEIPDDHPGKKSHGSTVDRSLLEVDAPYLFVTAPTAGATRSEDFEAVTTARPLFFQTEERLARPLYVARVMVSAEPRYITRGLEVANFKRFRLFAGRRPTTSASVAGGYAEIARLYLLRGETPADDEMHVQQLEYWCMGSVDNQPQSVIPDDFTTSVGAADLILQLIKQREADLLDAAGAVEFWTQ